MNRPPLLAIDAPKNCLDLSSSPALPVCVCVCVCVYVCMCVCVCVYVWGCTVVITCMHTLVMQLEYFMNWMIPHVLINYNILFV